MVGSLLAEGLELCVAEIDLTELRRAQMQEQAKLDRATQMQRVAEEAKFRIKQERENADVHLRQLRARSAEERKTRLEQIQAVFSGIGGGERSGGPSGADPPGFSL